MRVAEEITRHIGWISRTAAKICGDLREAEDLAGETIVKCLEQSHRFDPLRAFRPWFLTIMLNTYRTRYNRSKCIPFVGYDSCGAFPGGARADHFTLLGEVRRIIGSLERRSVCIRCVCLYMEGYNYAEIAEIVGVGVSTVKSRMRDGRKMLRVALRAGGFPV